YGPSLILTGVLCLSLQCLLNRFHHQEEKMIKKAKIHTREIPYFELLNPNFTFDCDFRRIDLKSLIFFQEPPEKYSGYLSFIGQQDVSHIFSSEAAKLRFGDGETVRITSFNFDGKMLSV